MNYNYGRVVGQLFISALPIMVFKPIDRPPYKHLTTYTSLEKGTVFLVTKRFKPMEDYQDELLLDSEQVGKNYFQISWCTELLTEDSFYYIYDQTWDNYYLHGDINYLDECHLPPL